MKALKITNATMVLCAKCALKEAKECGAPHLYLRAVELSTIEGTAQCYACKRPFSEARGESARLLELYLLPPSYELHEMSNLRTALHNAHLTIDDLRKELAHERKSDDEKAVPTA